jgi:hypothetical protein
MNKLCILLTLLVINVSCGRKAPDEAQNVFTEQYAVIYEMFVGHPGEAHQELKNAIRAHDGRIWDYDKTKWYLHDGRYLFKSIIINDETYKLEVEK